RLRRSLDHNPVLLSADEIAAVTISAYRKEIESSYRLRLPPHDLVVSLFNKSHFHRLATQQRWRTPPTLVLTCERDLERSKPLDFQQWRSSRTRCLSTWGADLLWRMSRIQLWLRLSAETCCHTAAMLYCRVGFLDPMTISIFRSSTAPRVE